MSPTSIDPASPPRAADRQASLYTELSRAVREHDLLRRRYVYYWSRIAAAVAAFVTIWFVVVWLGDSWLQLICAAALGLVITQFGFLGHDGAHRQIFASAAWNDWMARVFACGFAGLSYGWWRSKHNRHHAAPNQINRDPDISPGALVFTAEAADLRRTGVRGWAVQRQGWLFFPLLTLEGLNLHVASIRLLLQPGSIPHQRVEGLLVAGRLAAYVAVLLILLPIGLAAAFFAIQMAVFGVALGAAFAPNHKGMPIVAAGTRIDFLRRQVAMSRNVRGSFAVDAAMGGLNYQIEHHLFPSMPRPNLRLAQPIVREYCAKHDVPYTESSLFASYGIVVRYLNQVGIGSRDPFVCPLVTLYRN